MASAPMELLNIFLALLWLGGAVFYARANRPKETYQLRRVPRTVAAFTGGHALIALVLTALAGTLDIMSFHLLLLGVLILGMVDFLWVLLIDGIAVLLGATRNPQWLVVGILLINLFAYGWVFLIGAALTGAGPSAQSPVFFVPGLIAAAAGLIWWSELPRPESDVPGVFD